MTLTFKRSNPAIVCDHQKFDGHFSRETAEYREIVSTEVE